MSTRRIARRAEVPRLEPSPQSARDTHSACRVLGSERVRRTVVRTPVAVGTAENPTPRGAFFVTDRVRPPDPDSAYGAFALGLSGYSPTLTESNGADGQVGIQGTNDPSSIGRAASHGCIRVPDDVAQVLRQVPLGAPVVVT